MPIKQFAALALDLGSSNGRAVLGILNDRSLRLQEAHRFPHEATRHGNFLTWDTQRLRDGALAGISIAKTLVPISLSSIGIDTWGVDYALLDNNQELVHPVRAYRDERMTEDQESFAELFSPEELWEHTGVLPQTINTVTQLHSDLLRNPELLDQVSRLQLLPDYFGFLLSGELGFGRSIASTTGLAEPRTKNWSHHILNKLGIPERWLGPIGADKIVLAPEKTTGIPLVRPGGHDTSCAVNAIPVPEDVQHSVFISCGSWTLVGAITSEPILSSAAFEAGFTNETCVDGTNRLLCNVTGMWILQELMRDWQQLGCGLTLGEVLDAAKSAPSLGLVFDPNDPLFAGTGHMQSRIREYMDHHYQRTPDSQGQMARLVFESLAIKHASCIRQLNALSGQQAQVINMVGGGSRNGLLCQMTASAAGLPLLAGPAEASAAGNLLAQFEATEAIDAADRIEIIQHSFQPLLFEPRDPTRWEDMSRRLAEVTESAA